MCNIRWKRAGGYIMDRRVGNTEKLGALFGILAAIGHPLPTPGTLKYALAQAAQKVYGLASGARLQIYLSGMGILLVPNVDIASLSPCTAPVQR